MNLFWVPYSNGFFALRAEHTIDTLAVVDPGGRNDVWYGPGFEARVGYVQDEGCLRRQFDNAEDAKAWCEIVVQLQGEQP